MKGFAAGWASGSSSSSGPSGACGDTNETSDITKASPAITTTAGSGGTLPGAVTVSDVAHLTGLTETAGGSVTFKVYGPFSSQPGADSCTEGKLVAGGPYTVSVNGPGQYTSPSVTVKKAGFYVWVASYSGDANNLSATHEFGEHAFRQNGVGQVEPREFVLVRMRGHRQVVQ